MPFVNERLAANKALVAQRPEKSGLRQTRFRFDPDEVLAQLKARIVGQEACLQRIGGLLQIVRADICPDHRPLGVCLLLGPTGVGKTETVRALAMALHGSADALCRIDMNTLSQEHYASALTGAPPGYVGSKEGHTLFDTDKIQGSYSKPGIVLFDELEKASSEVIRSLLNVLDAGQLRLPAGNRIIDFRNSLIFMTSNLGSAELTQYQGRYLRGWRRWLKPDPETRAQILEQALFQRFDPEFINRIDHILEYQPLPISQADQLLSLELAKLQNRLQVQNAEIELSKAARHWLCRDYDPRFGARDIARRVRRELSPLLARSLLEHSHESAFVADLHHGELVVQPNLRQMT